MLHRIIVIIQSTTIATITQTGLKDGGSNESTEVMLPKKSIQSTYVKPPVSKKTFNLAQTPYTQVPAASTSPGRILVCLDTERTHPAQVWSNHACGTPPLVL